MKVGFDNLDMTDKEALQEIDRHEQRFAAAGFGKGVLIVRSDIK